MDLRLEHKTLRIDQDVALSALDLLAPVVASFLAAYAGGLHRLAIHAARTGPGIASETDPKPLSEGGVDPLPRPIQAPDPEVMVDGLPRREVVGKETPGAAATDDVEDGIEDLAGGVDLWTTEGLGGGQMGLDDLPLFVRKVGLVCSSHSARYPTEPPC